MNIQIVSDLHLEFQGRLSKQFLNSTFDEKDVDVLCLAGDIGTAVNNNNLCSGLKILCDKYPHVVFVCGNHEFYGSSKEKVFQILSEFQSTHQNFHWLENNSAIIDNQRFVGCTLWFDNDPNAIMLRKYLNDFSMIKDFNSWVFHKHRESRDFFKKTLKSDDIVISHHLPTFKSVDPRFAGDRMNSFYASNMDDIIADSSPKIWFHGHTHCSHDYMAGNTRVICNPFGYYMQQQNRDFNKKLIVTV